MKTLDERIKFVFENEAEQAHPAGMYVYKLHRAASPDQTMFVGNFYYNGTDDEITFDMTEIIQSDGFTIKEDAFNIDDIVLQPYLLNNKIVNKYYVDIVWDEEQEEIESSTLEYVAKVYTYKNKKLDINSPFFIPGYEEDKISITLQGYKDNASPVLIPHYPMFGVSDEQLSNICPFGMSFMKGSDVQSIPMVFETGTYKRSFTLTPTNYSFTYISDSSHIASHVGILATNDGNLYVDAAVKPDRLGIRVQQSTRSYLYIRYTDEDMTNTDFPYAYARVVDSMDKSVNNTSVNWDNVNTSIILYTSKTTLESGDYIYDNYNTSPDITSYPIIDTKTIQGGQILGGTIQAIFDVCPKRYYLFWQDRYGSFQCQPFNDKSQYSESFDRTEISDYQNRRRNATIQVQPKWKIDSDWISENLYPYYESIFTSPILFLYDTQQNRKFSVLVTGDYTEKTYKKQKRLINLSLELEENKTQRLIY